MKTYVFRIELEQEEDGRWSAEIPTLPGCATWGHTKEEAMRSLHEAARLYLESLSAHGDPIPGARPDAGKTNAGFRDSMTAG
jgi:predicted RNase H-like HicB family nuclease